MKKTMRYDWFMNHPQNRVTSESHVQALKAKIKAVNHLDANPIIVTEYNKKLDEDYVKGQQDPKYFVCQGAHRLRAAKELNVYIYYNFKSGLTSEDVQNLNTAKAWSPNDWLEFHQDKATFRELKNFKSVYSLSLSNAKSILSLTPTPSAKDFEAGLFKIPSIDISKKIALALNEMSTYLPKTTKKVPHSSRFVRYVISAMNRGFDLGHLVSQVQKYPHKILATPNEHMAQYVIKNVYNHNAKKRAKI